MILIIGFFYSPLTNTSPFFCFNVDADFFRRVNYTLTLSQEEICMFKNKLVIALVFAMSSFEISAQVPLQAPTFQTNVVVFNATDAMTLKLQVAQDHIRKVISTDEFRDRVINHSYNGVQTYVDNGGFTNEEIYQKILDGAERLNKISNNAMDIEVEMYYEDTSTVGYTFGSTPRIYANTKFYNSYSAQTITGNLTHEWLHKLGFTHASTYSPSRDYSVPYAVGKIMREMANTRYLEYLTSASQLTLTNSMKSLSLSWREALSSEGVTSYKVYRRPEGSATNYLQSSTLDLSFTQDLPAVNATYYVRALDALGNTTKSVEVQYVKLTAVSSLTLTSTRTTASLSWSPAQTSAGVREYRVYRRLVTSSTATLQVVTQKLGHSEARPSASAYYYVQAVDVNGAVKNSVEVKFVR